MIGKYKVITLCGSTKFKEDFFKVQKELTLKGNIVLNLGVFTQSDDEKLSEEIIEMLSDIHRHKIDMADEIYVINKNNYIGNSTMSEIKYAEAQGKVINYME